MARAKWLIAGLALTLLWGGCGSGDATKPTPPAWHAICLQLEATTDLNLFQNASHALSLYVVQMSDPADFTKASGSVATLLAYLDKGGQNANVTRFQQIVMQPGQQRVEVLDRIEGSKWVAVIAGYYYLDPQKCVRSYQLPDDTTLKLNLALSLGPDAILKAQKK